MRKVIALLAALPLAIGLTSCGKDPGEGAKHTKLQIEPRSSTDASPDATRTPIVVLAPPSAPQLVQKQQAALKTEAGKTEAEIHDLMAHYSENLRHPAEKAKYEQQIAQNLDAYKRQMLQLYKLERQADANTQGAASN